MTIRILLVDDHTVVRKGLRTFLAYDPDLEVEGSAADGTQATLYAIRVGLVSPGSVEQAE